MKPLCFSLAQYKEEEMMWEGGAVPLYGLT
jgi:hypothetical protein